MYVDMETRVRYADALVPHPKERWTMTRKRGPVQFRVRM